MPNILVLGDVMLDVFTHGESSRTSPEAPVPVVHRIEKTYFCGGAANLALNLDSLGNEVRLIAAIGEDEYGARFLKLCEKSNLKVETIPTLGTTVKNRLLVNSKHHLRIDSDYILTPSEADAYRESSKLCLNENGFLIYSDYAKGTNTYLKDIFLLAKSLNNTIFVDPKDRDWEIYRGVDFITPNLREIEIQIGTWESDSSSIQKCMDLLEKYQIGCAVITRGENGATAITRNGEVFDAPGIPVLVAELAGAGDTFLASFAFHYLKHRNLEGGIAFANLQASRAVSFNGISLIGASSLAELKKGQVND
jgi:D-beta-D-heptose 7-phosphate kinase/D-beta-D-heptose 1-phosphate adenosyltransferase